MIYGLILAAGSGKRMGEKIPKQYMKVGEKTIISLTVRRFIESGYFDKLLVLVPEDRLKYTEKILAEDFGGNNDIDVIIGGELRNDTIIKGINFIEERYGLDDETLLITHDGVRPFVDEETLAANINALKLHDVCDTVIPATDTIIKSEKGDYLDEIPDRKYLYQSQTPQSFKAKKFREYYLSLDEAERLELTDAIKVFAIKKEQVYLVKGTSTNIKITYPSDIILAEAILRNQYKNCVYKS
mgnify:FL=1